MNPLPEHKESLWMMIVSPTIWAGHFLLSYITAAIWCEKFAGPDRALGFVRTAIVIYTIVAVAGIAAVGWRGYRKHTFGESSLPHDYDSPQDRHRFIGFATFLLSGLSLVATLFEAMVAVFFWSCH